MTSSIKIYIKPKNWYGSDIESFYGEIKIVGNDAYIHDKLDLTVKLRFEEYNPYKNFLRFPTINFPTTK